MPSTFNRRNGKKDEQGVPLQENPQHYSLVSKEEDPEAQGMEHEASERLLADRERGGLEDEDGDFEFENVKGESVYDRKSKIINNAIQDIGMGRYQWELFVLCGFGWLVDNLWMQGLALILPQLSPEFSVDENTIRYTTAITYIGLCIGSSCWGIASDIIGRRPAFNATLFICGAFGLAVAFAPSWPATAGLLACMGLGVGGNLPVDGALFLEFLPFASGNLLTLLSVWWPFGQLIACFIAWGFIPNFSCDAELQLDSCATTGGVEPCCAKADNWGWRYTMLTLAILTLSMFACRFFLFHLYESPKFLLSRGKQAEAVAVVHHIAQYNKTESWLSSEKLDKVGRDPELGSGQKLNSADVIKRNFSKFSTDRIKPLFADRKLALSTAMIWLIWATIGMGYPLFNAFLPQYLENNGKEDAPPTPTAIVYRNLVLTSFLGVPGSILACYTVNIRYLGRRGTMALSTLISGIGLYFFTLSSNPDYQLLISCLESFTQNIMYGVLYAYTPEVFPAPNRGTGTGIASLLNRIAGMIAPAAAAQMGALHPAAPIYGAGIMYVAAFGAMCLLPIETMGKQSL